ncbi:hypothetical protein BBO99_00000248 [Phytophthora kernoviae]|uniref:Uncharacterized protein n=2 Tax=Phytophthora kernoviae TaxID=325452 RepID=A0A3R7K459_9STRA|nr:hypothetical protein G195_004671 [Phytophthora kernoviae 00238/432]KAG2523259.1 hypothetical protein JM18_005834 [Phytophthora kernoviae]KAG2528840.1 hypothetical protein JM16_002474 [Phytophthora kernoviae]RLN21372.1 hypothetical protein BBI17_000342 [Phytophthora kernoviae]RLN85701.1 hypothetical protein BBO99_00000248 [Phytophthora kernoviae]
MRSALAKENAELKRLGTVHSAMEKQVEQLAAALNKANATANLAHELRRANPTLVVNPLTLEQCSEIARLAYREVMTFRENKACFSTGMKVFGWRDRHKVYPDKLMFSLEKVFEGRTMEEVSQGTWEILSQPEVIACMYPRAMKPHFHVTQHLDENTVIYYHTLERESTDIPKRISIKKVN